MRCFEGRDGLFAGNRGKGIQEFVQAVTALQVIDEVPEGDSRAYKDRCASENLRITVDDSRCSWHILLLVIDGSAFLGL